MTQTPFRVTTRCVDCDLTLVIVRDDDESVDQFLLRRTAQRASLRVHAFAVHGTRGTIARRDVFDVDG
jgi:hypothetical protein